MDDTAESADGIRLSRGSLRLNFRSLVPEQLRSNEWSPEIGLFVANEHGIFSRKANPQVVQWKITCELLQNYEVFSVPDLQMIEPFTPAGRCKISIRSTVEGSFDAVFRVLDCEENEIMPVISPFTLRLTKLVEDENRRGGSKDRDGFISCRRLISPKIDWMSSPPQYFISESAFSLGIGGKVWDGAITLLEFLFASPTRWTDLGLPISLPCKIVDLGSATGLLGIGIAKMKPECTIINTDLPEIIPLLRTNQEGIENVQSETYSWGSDSKSEVLKNIDILVMSDVVYEQEYFEPLLQSIQKLGARNVLMSHRHRNFSEADFFRRLSRLGTVEILNVPISIGEDEYSSIISTFIKSPISLEQQSAVKGLRDVAIFKIKLY